MEYSKDPPPIYARAKELWGVDFEKGNVVFTYGNMCHTSTGSIPLWLIPHEEQHTVQQREDPQAWWDRYFVDPQFRLEQEMEAYRVQYQWIEKNIPGRQQKFTYLKKFAQDLSGPMYGSIISFGKAMEEIKHG